ncbi:hypothetical protein ABS771_08480 [Methylobacterium brachiatum]|uniref:Uncharacterized protein n=1 Tax=Methylobacterium brachiatum TaxID=269660 RepID=A0ABV1QVN2_9HYPH
MTPDQVISASNGRVKRTDPAFLESHKDYAPVNGSHRLTTGDDASVSFYFKESRLVHVTLHFITSHATEVPRLLRQTYGEPIFKEISSGKYTSDKTEWRSEKYNLHIELTEMRMGLDYPSLSITYRPLFEPTQSGL